MKLSTLRASLCIVGMGAAMAPSTAEADSSKKVCTDAYAQAQNLRDAHKMKEARDQLRICSQSACTDFIVKDCTTWLLQAEASVPSVVFSAKDGRGQPLVNVTVAVDGKPLASKLDGQSIEVDPGSYTFTFVATDGAKVEQPFTVIEGQKAQVVLANFPTLNPPNATPPPTPSTSGDTSFWTTQHKLGVVSGGVGVAGIAVASIFGLLAKSAADQQKTDCASPTSCNSHGQALSDHSTAATDSTVSTAAFIAGGVLVAGGVVLLLTGHRGSEEPIGGAGATGLIVTPGVGPGGGAMFLKGEF